MHLPLPVKFCQPLKVQVLPHLTAQALLVKFCQPLKVLVLLHLTAQALPVKFCQLPKVLLLHHVPLARFFLLLSLLERVHLLHSHQPLLEKYFQLLKVLPLHRLMVQQRLCLPVKVLANPHSVQPPAKFFLLLKVQPVHHLMVQPSLCSKNAWKRFLSGSK